MDKLQKDIDALELQKAQFETLMENEKRLKSTPASEYTDEDDEILQYLIGRVDFHHLIVKVN